MVFRAYREVAAGVMLLPTMNSHGNAVIAGSPLIAKCPSYCDLRHMNAARRSIMDGRAAAIERDRRVLRSTRAQVTEFVPLSTAAAVLSSRTRRVDGTAACLACLM